MGLTADQEYESRDPQNAALAAFFLRAIHPHENPLDACVVFEATWQPMEAYLNEN